MENFFKKNIFFSIALILTGYTFNNIHCSDNHKRAFAPNKEANSMLISKKHTTYKTKDIEYIRTFFYNSRPLFANENGTNKICYRDFTFNFPNEICYRDFTFSFPSKITVCKCIIDEGTSDSFLIKFKETNNIVHFSINKKTIKVTPHKHIILCDIKEWENNDQIDQIKLESHCQVKYKNTKNHLVEKRLTLSNLIKHTCLTKILVSIAETIFIFMITKPFSFNKKRNITFSSNVFFKRSLPGYFLYNIVAEYIFNHSPIRSTGSCLYTLWKL